MNPDFNIITLGCKVNQYESEALCELMQKAGFVLSKKESADVFIINTCTVTGESDRKCRQMIRKAQKSTPSAAILVIGCFSQVSYSEVAKIEGVDYIGGSTNKSAVIEEALDIIKNGKRAFPKINIKELDNACFEEMKISSFGRTRAYIKIEDGCNNRCSYCIIPTARGRVRSRSAESVIDEINTISQTGCREVVLTGIETDAYGLDFGDYRLAELTEDVLKETDIERIRFGSLDPSLFKEDFVNRICTEERILPHFHISMQSGCSRTLASMQRRYNASMAHDALERIRKARPDVQFSGDIIVGFPGESDEDFCETLEFLKRERFLTLHVFQYSKRNGTRAAEMKNQVPPEIKKRRSEILISEQKKIRASILQENVGKEIPLLIERIINEGGKAFALGHTPTFIQMRALLKTEHKRNNIVKIRITSFDEDFIYGEEIQE